MDLDIAVFGSSREEVMDGLREAIDLHMETVAELPVEDRQAMLVRRSPLHVRIVLALMSTCLPVVVWIVFAAIYNGRYEAKMRAAGWKLRRDARDAHRAHRRLPAR